MLCSGRSGHVGLGAKAIGSLHEFGRYVNDLEFRARWIANDPHCFAAINRMHMKTNLVPELKNIRCPTLVIGCRHNTIRTPAMSRGVAEAIAGAVSKVGNDLIRAKVLEVQLNHTDAPALVVSNPGRRARLIVK